MKPDLLILYSGGADSTLLIERALASGRKPYCVMIDYDQNQKIELEFAKRYLNEKSVPNQTVWPRSTQRTHNRREINLRRCK